MTLWFTVNAELPEDCRGRWESFVDETLRETNRRNTVELVRCSFSTIQRSSMNFSLLTSSHLLFFFSQFKPTVFSAAR